MQKKTIVFLFFFCSIVQGMWAQTEDETSDTQWKEVSTETELKEAIAEGKKARMTINITLSSTLTIVNGKDASIDMNGFTLARSLTAASDQGSVIRVESGGKLSLSDEKYAEQAITKSTVTGGMATNGGGICNYGTLTLRYVNITDCYATNSGAGVYNAYKASLDVTGGIISNNVCLDKGGGIFNDGTIDITKTVREKNKAKLGGGIYNYNFVKDLYNATLQENEAHSSGGGIYNDQDCALYISGAEIFNNRVGAGQGGGIYNKGKTVIEDVYIKGNVCAHEGGGIYAAETATLKMAGAVTIKENFEHLVSLSNLYLEDGRSFEVTGPISSSLGGVGISIGKNTGYTVGQGAKPDDGFFFADNSGHSISVSQQGEQYNVEYSIGQTEGNWTDDGNMAVPEMQSDNVYLIANAQNLAWLAKQVNDGADFKDATIKQTADIDLSGHYWIPIGNEDHYFNGTYEGQNHIISGMHVDRTSQSGNGLFGHIGGYIEEDRKIVTTGSVKNVYLIKSQVKGGDYTGALCGYFHYGEIYDCISDAVVEGGQSDQNVGGLVGTTGYYTGERTGDNGQPESFTVYARMGGNFYTGKSVSSNKAIVGKKGEQWYSNVNWRNFYTLNALTTDEGAGALANHVIIPDVDVNYEMERTNYFIMKSGMLFVFNVEQVVTLTPKDANEEMTAVLVNNTSVTADNNGRYTFYTTDNVAIFFIAFNHEVRLKGEGTEDNPYLIASQSDWQFIANTVADNTTYQGKYFKFTDDITVNSMIGVRGSSEIKAFWGNIDGDGHTLTFNMGTENEPFSEGWYCAPFCFFNGQYIKKLNVKGEIFAEDLYDAAAGLIGSVAPQKTSTTTTATTLIEDCRSSIAIHSTHTNGFVEANTGGFVGFINNFNGGIVNFNRCVFDGSLENKNQYQKNNYCGGFVANASDGGSNSENNKINFTNCLFVPEDVQLDGLVNNAAFITIGNVDNVSFTNCHALPKGLLQQPKQTFVHNEALDIFGAETGSNAFMTAFDYAIKFKNTYYTSLAPLADTGNNSAQLSNLNGKEVDAYLSGRTLYKDGSWNTLCLPFDVILDHSPLANATVKTLASSNFDGGTLTLTFEDAYFTNNGKKYIEAGKPFLVKWEPTNEIITNPIFPDVKIEANEIEPIQTDYVHFVGCFSPVELNAGDKTSLYLGDDNTLYYPKSDVDINSFRAYFQLKNNITAGDLENSVNAIVMNFDGDATGVQEIEKGKVKNDYETGTWYDLSGRRVSNHSQYPVLKSQLKKGIYIHNGHKVVVK